MEWMKKWNAIGLRVCLLILFVCFQLPFFLLFRDVIKTGTMFPLDWVFAVLVQIVLLAFFLRVLCSWPWVSFSEDAVSVMILFKTRQYRWKDICQVGVLRLYREGNAYPNFVILLPGGSRRKYKDKSFQLRNMTKLISIPYTPAIRMYVNSHYGPLDFDLWNHPEEKSIEIDDAGLGSAYEQL